MPPTPASAATLAALQAFSDAAEGVKLATPLNVVICGGGNAAHVLSGVLGHNPNLSVSLYSSLPHEVEAFKASQGDGIAISKESGDFVGKLAAVTSDPQDVIPNAQVIIISVPAFAHEAVVGCIAPYVSDGAVLGVLPARSFFDLALKDKLGDKVPRILAYGLQTLPWACRINEYGKSASILGVKAEVDMCVSPDADGTACPIVAQALGKMFGLKLKPVKGGFITVTLANVGQLIHPGITYGRYANWDGKPLAEKPLFYQGVDEFTAEVLSNMSDEIQALKAKIESEVGVDLSDVNSLLAWLLKSYEAVIGDKSTMQTCFNTNAAYKGLTHPMKEVEGGEGFNPDFNARYLTEDVPYGLLGTCAVAKIAGVATPTIDKVCLWAQEKIGKEYLVGDKLTGKDIARTHIPQRYGITTLAQLFN